MSNLPPLPPGFVLEDEERATDSMPALPEGFELMAEEGEQPTSFRDAQRMAAEQDQGALSASTTAGAQGLTWGASDEIMAGAFTPLEMAIGAITGEDADKGLMERARDAYARGLELQRVQLKTAREEHPVASLAGEVAGGAMTAGVGMGAAKTVLGKMAVGAGEGVAAGGVTGFMSGEGLEDRLEKAETGAKIGAGVGAVLPAAGTVVGAAVRGGKTFVEPFTEAGRERIAARRLADGATDADAVRRSLDEGAEELVPGSEPTTFQATGDMGLGAMERVAQNRRPDLFMQRRADQNSARVGALEGIQPDGSPEAVADAIRQRFQMIDDETQAALDAARGQGDVALEGATRAAQNEAGALGTGATPDVAGDRIRGALEAARKEAKIKERALWGVVDPDGTLTAPTSGVRDAAGRIVSEMPATAEPLAAKEAALYDTINGLGETIPFRDMQGLRTRVSDAIKAERRDFGETAALRRMTILRGALEDDLSGSIVQKVAQETDAVSRGVMDVNDTTLARFEAKKAFDPIFVRSKDGQSFVAAQAGKPDLGMAPRVEGEGDIPIRVRRGDLTRHIASPVHYEDAEVLGYSDPWELVKDVSANWTEMRAGEKGRMLLVKPAPDANGVAVVELAPVDGGDYWRIVTAGRRADKQLGDTIRVRTLLPDSASGNDASLIARSPQGRQEAGLAQDRIGSEDMPAAPPAPAPEPNFDEAARDRLKAATTATRERAETFDNKTLGPLRKRPSTTAPYDVGSSSVPGTIFKPGAKGFDSIETYRRAVADDPEAMGAIRDFAVDRFQRAASRPDGTVDAGKARTWLNVHKDALRAFPELDAQIRRAADASDTMAGADTARAGAVKAAESARTGTLAGLDQGSLGKLRAETDRTEIGKLVGKAFDATASAQEMLKIKMAIGRDAPAQEGLKRAVVDDVVRRFVGTGEAGASGVGTLKSDGFQQFVRKNKAALKGAGFGDEQIEIFVRITADLQQSNRSNIALKNPGGSDTAQNMLSVQGKDGPMTALGKVLAESVADKSTRAVSAAGGVTFGATTGDLIGGAAIAGAGIAAQVVAAMRAAKLEKVEDIVADALLNPERARLLLSKATGKGERDVMARLVKVYTNAATVAGTLEGTAGSPPAPTDRERADSPRLTQDDRSSPIPSDLIDDGKAVMDGAPIGGASATEAPERQPDAGRERWDRFPAQSGTMNVPRAEMPQIKSEHRGALTNFVTARGIEHSEETVPADSLKATQTEFSPERVATARARTGGNRAVLVSSDWQVLDGHHQWLAAKEAGEDIRVIRFDAPIGELLDVVKEFPSATQEAAADRPKSKLAQLEEKARERRAARAAA